MDRFSASRQSLAFRRPISAAPGTPPIAELARAQSGCHTCVARGVRCSEQKPICRQCEDHQRACKWSEAEPRFTPTLLPTPKLGRTPSPPEHARKRVKRASPDYTYGQGPELFNNAMEGRRSDGPLLPAHPSGHPVFTRKVSPKTRRAEPLTPNSKARSKTNSLSSTLSTASTAMLVPDGSYSPKNLAGRVLPTAPDQQRTKLGSMAWPTRSLLRIEPVSHNSSMLFRPDLGGDRRSSQLLCPPPMDLHAYCNARRGSQTSTTLGLLRKTYLARFTSGCFDMAFLKNEGEGSGAGAFSNLVIPLFDEIDGDTATLLQDPMRLQDSLECSVFQEAYVLSLRRPAAHNDPQTDILRRWIAALFLLSMSLERGLDSHALHHASMAIFCFKLLDVKARYTGDLRKSLDASLLFLSEATFRYCANVALLTGERCPIEVSALPVPIHPLDQLMQQTVAQRLQAFDLLKQLAVATLPPDRSGIARRLETTLAELMACDRQIDRIPARRLPPSPQQSFGSVGYEGTGWTVAAMQVVVVKVLITSIVDGFDRESLLVQYFAMLDSLIMTLASPTQVKVTLDTTGLLLLGAMIQVDAQRGCLLELLQQAHARDLGTALRLTDAKRILQHVWHLQDSKGTLDAIPNSPYSAAFLRDISIIRDVQVVYGDVMGERRGLIVP